MWCGGVGGGGERKSAIRHMLLPANQGLAICAERGTRSLIKGAFTLNDGPVKRGKEAGDCWAPCEMASPGPKLEQILMVPPMDCGTVMTISERNSQP